MANPILLKTSCFFGLAHFIAMYIYQETLPQIYCTILTIGILTSIWNHGTTSEIAKWGDRICIALAVMSAIYHITLFSYRPNSIIVFSVITLAITCYFIAKNHEKKKEHYKRDFCHGSSHMIATAAHVTIIAILSTQDQVDWSQAYSRP